MNDTVRSGVHWGVWALMFIACASLLGYGYYLQYVEYLDPCPLCITQRLFYYGIGISALLALVSARKVILQRVFAFLMMLLAIGGIVTAGRQVWLQHLPKDQVPECGPGLAYWLENNPWMETLSLLFKGDGNCAEVQWTFLGFSIGEWSLAWFVGFLIVSLVLIVRLARAQR